LLPRSQFAQPFSEEGKTFHLAVGVKRPTENRESRGKHNFRGTHKRASTSSSSSSFIIIIIIISCGMFQQFTQNLKLIRKLFGQSKLQFAVFAGRQVEGKYMMAHCYDDRRTSRT